MRRVVVIGGTDPSGGAGLTRDAAMAVRMGCEVKPVVTAVTVQTDTGVDALNPVPPSVVRAQLQAALAAPMPAAIKIGMVATDAQVAALAELLPQDLPLVFDPVLRASSGGTLSAAPALRPLIGRSTLLTPNLPEAACLSDLPVAVCADALQAQARALLALGAGAVLIKGGHARGDHCVDHLFTPQGTEQFAAPRVAAGKRGTGCSLATAIACRLAAGADLAAACRSAKAELTRWLRL
ncbi:hydroxymethylpyrimidine/phosphomethylpyrimidine kinase [Epibacterium sp. Ofav1-8]|nr:hydroxymethylpyrimidine/phosphomethylpyrimidine kinase [Epibacterium sp. Ofav1-8]